MDFFFGEDTSDDLKDEINTGMRIAIIRSVNLNYLSSGTDEDEQTNEQNYGTIDLQMMNPPGYQKQILIPTIQFGLTSGNIDVPEINSIAMCLFFPNSRAVCVATKSAGDTSGNSRFISDLVKSGLLPQLQQGDHVKWSGSKAFSLVRTCTKVIKQTIGSLLNNDLTAVKVNGKAIHYNIQHETGTLVQFDEDGNCNIKLASGKKLYLNEDGSTATDSNALVTRAFLLNFYNSFITTFNAHTHPYVNVSTPSTTSPTLTLGTQVSASMPDTVSTPDIRAKVS